MSEKLIDTLFLGTLACLVIAPFVTVKIFRFIIRSRGLTELVEEGCAVTDKGLKILGYANIGTKLIPFDQIESVELLTYPNALGRMLLSSLSSRHFFKRASRAVVHVRLRDPHRYTELFIANLFFTPKDPVALANRLNSRISGRD